jgi:exodeoxyribonuclease-3
MKISSWNVNSVRARIDNILNYIKISKPDILIIQEIKTEEKNFPFNHFKNLGYESYVFGQKSYNGVAILSKQKINKINTQFIKDQKKQSRVIEGDIKNKKKKYKTNKYLCT